MLGNCRLLLKTPGVLRRTHLALAPASDVGLWAHGILCAVLSFGNPFHLETMMLLLGELHLCIIQTAPLLPCNGRETIRTTERNLSYKRVTGTLEKSTNGLLIFTTHLICRTKFLKLWWRRKLCFIIPQWTNFTLPSAETLEQAISPQACKQVPVLNKEKSSLIRTLYRLKTSKVFAELKSNVPNEFIPFATEKIIKTNN